MSNKGIPSLLDSLTLFTTALGDILVGLVTMYADGVHKGSALMVTAAVQEFIDRAPPPSHIGTALSLVISSTISNQKYPYAAKEKKTV